MKIKSTVLQVLAAASLGAGLLYAMGIEGGAQLGGTITDGEFVTAMVLILTSLALMRISFAVQDAKSGDLLASGTAAMCARRLGYASANSFAASVCHWLKDGRQHVKYICQRELIPRSEVDSLPRKPKRPARVRSTDEPKGDGICKPHHPEG